MACLVQWLPAQRWFSSFDGGFVMNPFKGKRRVLWLGGMFVLVVGLLAAATVLPTVTATPGAGGPTVDVPKMQNVPSEEAPKMRLETAAEQK
jgi:hypothetical protein